MNHGGSRLLGHDGQGLIHGGEEVLDVLLCVGGEKQRRLLCRMPRSFSRAIKRLCLGKLALARASRWLMIFSFLVNTGKERPRHPLDDHVHAVLSGQSLHAILGHLGVPADQAERLSVVGLQLPDSLQHSRGGQGDGHCRCPRPGRGCPR